MMIFKDRIEAGNQLAEKLQNYKNKKDVIVIGLPRGGVVVARACAQALNLPYDLLAVRKVGMPWQPECALGAVGFEGTRYIDQRLVSLGNLEQQDLEALIKDQQEEAVRRMKTYRPGHKPLDLTGKNVVLVDDGIATGATMKVAVMVARALQAALVVVAVPVLPAEEVSSFEKLSDELVFLQAPKRFGAVGAFYQHFEQVSDDQVIALMQQG